MLLVVAVTSIVWDEDGALNAEERALFEGVTVVLAISVGVPLGSIWSLKEDELEEFEQNLGTSRKKQIGDFENLNGHQFEDYLKEVFSILGYQVIRTKLSGDQGADLIIKKDEQKIYNQDIFK